MSNVDAEQIIAESDLRAAIFEAREDGDDKTLASLLGELVERNTDHEVLRMLEIQALQRSCDWSDADARAVAGMQVLPDSIHLARLYAFNAFWSLNSHIAIDRFRDVRKRFDPEKHLLAAMTIFHELLCYYNTTEMAEASTFIESYLDIIFRYDASEYGMKFEVFECMKFVPSSRIEEYCDWLMKGASPEEVEFFKRWMDAFATSRQWVTSNAPNIEIVSLGQNCLPWSLPIEQGLRPQAFCYDPFGPFDFLGLGGDIVAECLETNFELLLDRSQFIETITPQNLSLLYSRSYQAKFEHEKGPWWAENEWARLFAAYEGRIGRFREGVRKARRLYVYCLCSTVNLGRLIDAYEAFLDDQNSRLLIINVLSEKMEIEIKSTKIETAHVPYPEDYVWYHFPERYTPRGLAFESEIVQAIIDALGKMNQG